MNDLIPSAKLLIWISGMVVALGLLSSLGKLTYRMAVSAIEAHQHDQISYGKFSRGLWSAKKKQKRL